MVLIIIIIIIIFFDPGTQFPRKEKITLCNIKKYKNQAGMNLIIIIIIIIIIFKNGIPRSKDPRNQKLKKS